MTDTDQSDYDRRLDEMNSAGLKERAGRTAEEELAATRLERRENLRPSIEHLELGVAVAEVDGSEGLVPLFDVGDRVVVERRSDLIGGGWLDTRVLRVQSIDDVTGVVRCRDEEADQLTYVSFKEPLHDIRLAPAKGDPFSAPKVRMPIAGGQQSAEGKRGRGRPKGSKNRPKEVVEAERADRQASRRKGRAGR